MGTDPAIRPAAGRLARRFLWTIVVGVLGHAGSALAFPLIDPTNQGTAGAVAGLTAPDAQDLTHQLQIANGAPGVGAAGGWTFQPRLGVEESLTDNVLQVHRPMRWDLTTALSPGISITGQTQRAQVRVDYAPVLIVNARTGNQNALNQQLNATANITVIDELVFVDLRALAGVQSARGAAGSTGTIGAGSFGGLSAGSTAGLNAANGNVNNQQNNVQTSSVGISPYLLKRFGDYGTLKLGYSLNLAQSSPVTGFQYLPFPTGGASQRLMTTEQTAEFRSGDFLNDFQDTISVDFSQSTSTGQANAVGSIGLNAASFASNRQIVSNALNYAISRSLVLTVSIGHEKIVYSGSNALTIDDVTWSVGGTFTPNANSAITISYGHQQGSQSFSFNGHYQLTPRTTISGSYTDSLGTQLENLQQQLNQGVVNANGSFVNGQTGGQLFGSTNAAPIQPGVFHFKTLTATATTQLNRDTISLTLNASTQTSVGGAASLQTSSQSNGINMTWTHDLRPDMRLTTSASYNVNNGGSLGNSQTIAFNTSLIYTLTESVSASARYSFFKSTSQNTLFSLYEDIFVVGLTKQF
jgi:uncharacterized protein (PEP-CTERM system associated)